MGSRLLARARVHSPSNGGASSSRRVSKAPRAPLSSGVYTYCRQLALQREIAFSTPSPGLWLSGSGPRVQRICRVLSRAEEKTESNSRPRDVRRLRKKWGNVRYPTELDSRQARKNLIDFTISAPPALLPSQAITSSTSPPDNSMSRNFLHSFLLSCPLFLLLSLLSISRLSRLLLFPTITHPHPSSVALSTLDAFFQAVLCSADSQLMRRDQTHEAILYKSRVLANYEKKFLSLHRCMENSDNRGTFRSKRSKRAPWYYLMAFKIHLSFIFNDSNGKSHVFENWVPFVPITFQVNWQKYTVGN